MHTMKWILVGLIFWSALTARADVPVVERQGAPVLGLGLVGQRLVVVQRAERQMGLGADRL